MTWMAQPVLPRNSHSGRTGCYSGRADRAVAGYPGQREIDFDSAGTLQEQAGDAMKCSTLGAWCRPWGDVSLCDSSVLSVLLNLWKTARSHGGTLALARVSSICDLALTRTGLAKVLGVWSSVNDAPSGTAGP